jgi:hypothetical protein
MTDDVRVLRPSRVKVLGLLLLTALFTATGTWMITRREPAGWVLVAFFGLGVIIFAVLLLPNNAYLRLEPEGFTVCSMFRAHTSRWADIDCFCVGVIGHNRMVVFNYSAAYRKHQSSRKVARALAGFEGALPDTYGMSAGELADLMNQYRGRHATS